LPSLDTGRKKKSNSRENEATLQRKDGATPFPRKMPLLRAVALFALVSLCGALRRGLGTRNNQGPRVAATSLPVSLNLQVQYAFDAANPFWGKSGYATAAKRQEGAMFQSPAFKLFDFLFGIPLVHDIMFGVYRLQIVEKSEKLGLPWSSVMDEQWAALDRLKARAQALADPSVVVPDYYYAPIHAYKDGNLCWESAMEEDLWSKMVSSCTAGWELALELCSACPPLQT